MVKHSFLIIFQVLLQIVFLLLITSCSRQTTYYIDPLGNDTNPGLKTSAPWKTLEKVNSTIFLPGDRILFSAGGEWTGQLHPKGSGKTGNPIRIGKYGKGEKPSINGIRVMDKALTLI